MSIPRRTTCLTARAIVSISTWVVMSYHSSLWADVAKFDANGPQPVEESMHEFMEYAFEPSYLRLKQQLAAEPTSNSGWKAIKADSLILAEATNLLWFRQPEEGMAEWTNVASSVRQSGAALYESAKTKNFQGAREHYTAMLQRCNSCHQRFADGKYQLQP